MERLARRLASSAHGSDTIQMGDYLMCQRYKPDCAGEYPCLRAVVLHGEADPQGSGNSLNLGQSKVLVHLGKLDEIIHRRI